MSGADHPTSDHDLATRGQELSGGRYRLVEQIGRGGTSVIWRAHDEILDRDVAVKLLSPTVDARFWPAIRAEARSVGKLTSAHIAHVYDYGVLARAEGGTTPYLVMELVEGQPLSRRIISTGVLPWAEAARTCAQIAEALAAAHARGLVHRDVKPDNVLLTDEGVKVIDFGISAVVGSPDVEDDGHVVGTAAYLAPERLVNVPVGPAADVYALGVLLYRALAGHLPWDADGRTALLSAHLVVEPAPLPPIDGLPPELAEICAACLEKDPNARPTAAEFAERVGALAAGAPAAAYEVAEERPRRRPMLVATTAGAVLALFTGAWAFTNRVDGDNASSRTSLPATGPVACAATFSVDKDWGTGFSARLTVTNNTPTVVTDWRVTFAFAGDQQLAQGPAVGTQAGSDTRPNAGGTVSGGTAVGGTTPAVVQQQGRAVTATAAITGQVLVPYGAVTVPISASYHGVNPIPTAVNLNTSACRTVVTGAAYRPRPAPPPTGQPGGKHTSSPAPARHDNHGRGNDNGNGGTGNGGGGPDRHGRQAGQARHAERDGGGDQGDQG